MIRVSDYDRQSTARVRLCGNGFLEARVRRRAGERAFQESCVGASSHFYEPATEERISMQKTGIVRRDREQPVDLFRARRLIERQEHARTETAPAQLGRDPRAIQKPAPAICAHRLEG